MTLILPLGDENKNIRSSRSSSAIQWVLGQPGLWNPASKDKKKTLRFRRSEQKFLKNSKKLRIVIKKIGKWLCVCLSRRTWTYSQRCCRSGGAPGGLHHKDFHCLSGSVPASPHSWRMWEPSNITYMGTQGQRHQTLEDTLNVGRFPNRCENSSRKMCSNSLPRRSGGRGTVEPLLTVPCDPITSGNGSSGNN